MASPSTFAVAMTYSADRTNKQMEAIMGAKQPQKKSAMKQGKSLKEKRSDKAEKKAGKQAFPAK